MSIIPYVGDPYLNLNVNALQRFASNKYPQIDVDHHRPDAIDI